MKLLVVSTNAAQTMGGEAVKALRYMQQLLANGRKENLMNRSDSCSNALTQELPAKIRLMNVRDSAHDEEVIEVRTPGQESHGL